MLTFRSRPKQLELRRTSSCSSLFANRNVGAGGKTKTVADDNPLTLCCITSSSKMTTIELQPPPLGPRIHLQPVQEGIEHISLFNQSVPMCTFCGETCAKAHNDDCTRLKIVSRGSQAKNTFSRSDLMTYFFCSA